MGTILVTGTNGTWGVKNGAGIAAKAVNNYKFPGDTDNEALAAGGNGATPPSGTVGATAGAGGAATATDPIDLGAIATGSVLDIAVNLSVTSNAAGAGFYGNFILGNAPATLAAFSPNTDAHLWLSHFGQP